MLNAAWRVLRHPLAVAAAVALCACSDAAPVAPDGGSALDRRAAHSTSEAQIRRVATLLRRVTARYHDVDAAIADGFVFFHPCEVRPGEGAVGALYVHFDRLLDGEIRPELPDALVYEPARNGEGKPKLVAVEFAIPYALWSGDDPPNYLGADFQPEDEYGVFGLHVWVWRNNPDGMFAEANPRVSCGASESAG